MQTYWRTSKNKTGQKCLQSAYNNTRT